MASRKPPTSPATGVPEIFDAHLLAVRQRRGERRRARAESFLLRRMIEDLAERLGDVTRSFDRALLVAPTGARAALLGALPDGKVGTLEARTPDTHLGLGVEAGTHDLVVALLGPGLVNDLPGALIEMRRALRPDGLLVAAWLGGDTLAELRRALYGFDQASRGGLTPRVHPSVSHVEAAALMGRAGLALPVVDVDRFTVRYRELGTLVGDLRDLGLTNALVARDRAYLGKGALAGMAAHYLRDADGRFPATFEVLWLTGWSPHESQPKPLKPGSATTRLADALGTRERKL